MILEALEFSFFRRALVAGLLASITCGVVGTYVVVKEVASISGGLAHAAFGGIGLGYLLGFPPMLGAAGFGVLSGLGIGVGYRHLEQGLETLVMIVWSVGMALGIVFIAAVPGYAPDLTTYLFGNILFVTPLYLWLTALLNVVLLATVVLLYRELQGVAFDEEFAEIVGVRVGAMVLLLLGLTSLAVVVLIRVVGVLLVVALLTIPAATARHWARGLRGMMLLATGAGALAIVAGLFIAYWLSAAFGVEVPTGPLIVLISAAGFGLSLLARGSRAPSLEAIP